MSIETLEPRLADVGGIPIARLLPNTGKKPIGAWCFLDHAGPVVFPQGEGLDVGPHPHIGLQTFTWMLAGEVRIEGIAGVVSIHFIWMHPDQSTVDAEQDDRFAVGAEPITDLTFATIGTGAANDHIHHLRLDKRVRTACRVTAQSELGRDSLSVSLQQRAASTESSIQLHSPAAISPSRVPSS